MKEKLINVIIMLNKWLNKYTNELALNKQFPVCLMKGIQRRTFSMLPCMINIQS